MVIKKDKKKDKIMSKNERKEQEIKRFVAIKIIADREIRTYYRTLGQLFSWQGKDAIWERI